MCKGLIALVGLVGIVFNPAYAVSETFDELRLIDVQTDIGGHRFILKGNGEYEIKIVKPSRSGQNNEEFIGYLDSRDLKRINRALKASRFETINLPSTKGGVSDSGPVIQLISNGNTVTRQKMTGIRHRRFDELYGTLLAIINKIGRKKRLQPEESDNPVLP